MENANDLALPGESAAVVSFSGRHSELTAFQIKLLREAETHGTFSSYMVLHRTIDKMKSLGLISTFISGRGNDFPPRYRLSHAGKQYLRDMEELAGARITKTKKKFFPVERTPAPEATPPTEAKTK